MIIKKTLRVTAEAKKCARLALSIREKLPASKRFGITKEQATKLGINSGVERAKQIINSANLPWHDAVRVARFYQRFKNKEGPRAQGAIDLWGGRAFGEIAVKFVKKNKIKN